MQFFDVAKVKCSSGAGGDGAVAARREKYVPYGGPAGGNGGKGGAIIVRADSQLTTLQALHERKHIKAKPGEPGKIKEQYGKDAEDTIILVPLGTTVKELHTKKILCTLESPGEQYELLAGGKGGIGNMHFKSSVHQYSNFALLGEPGQSNDFEFELQLIADVALLGVPSVGKTSLLNVISAAAAKTAHYPFTTIVPNLGVVTSARPPFVVIDVPGLIEGAASGRGLGNEFLRHITKARIRVLVMDISGYEQSIEECIQLIQEVELYIATTLFPGQGIVQLLTVHHDHLVWRVVDEQKTIIFEKYVLIAINKIDLVADEEVQEEVIREFIQRLKKTSLCKASTTQLKKHVLLVSAGSQKGVGSLIERCSHLLSLNSPSEASPTPTDGGGVAPVSPKKKRNSSTLAVKDITQESVNWLVEHNYLEEKERKYVYVREVAEPELTYLVYVLPRGNDEAEIRFWRVLEKKGILKDLQRAGVKKGDVLYIRSSYAHREDRRIRRD